MELNLSALCLKAMRDNPAALPGERFGMSGCRKGMCREAGWEWECMFGSTEMTLQSPSGFPLPKFEYIRVKPAFYKFTQSVCCSLPFKLNILFFLPGRKTPRRAPIVAALAGDRLCAVTLAPVLQQQLQSVLDKQCPSICSALDSWGCLFPLLSTHAGGSCCWVQPCRGVH